MPSLQLYNAVLKKKIMLAIFPYISYLFSYLLHYDQCFANRFCNGAVD